MSTERRRATDRQQEEITSLIKEEADPKFRVVLMLLQQISLNQAETSSALQENTEITNKFAAKLNSHLDAYEARLNKGRGAWVVFVWVFGIIQAVFGYVLVNGLLLANKFEAHIVQDKVMDAELVRELVKKELNK